MAREEEEEQRVLLAAPPHAAHTPRRAHAKRTPANIFLMTNFSPVGKLAR